LPDGNAEHFPGPIHQPPLVANVDAIQPHEHAEHAHHPQLQHHFDDMAQQAEASTLGMWVFLITEIMFFGGLFMAYLLYRSNSPEGVKAIEYTDKFTHHLVPGPHFRWEGHHPAAAEMFYSLYFCMTGLHALHMIIGLGIMTWLLVTALKDRYDSDYYTPVEVAGLYWHFVDIVWIFLFPLLYLIGAHAA